MVGTRRGPVKRSVCRSQEAATEGRAARPSRRFVGQPGTAMDVSPGRRSGTPRTVATASRGPAYDGAR